MPHDSLLYLIFNQVISEDLNSHKKYLLICLPNAYSAYS